MKRSLILAPLLFVSSLSLSMPFQGADGCGVFPRYLYEWFAQNLYRSWLSPGDGSPLTVTYVFQNSMFCGLTKGIGFGYFLWIGIFSTLLALAVFFIFLNRFPLKIGSGGSKPFMMITWLTNAILVLLIVNWVWVNAHFNANDEVNEYLHRYIVITNVILGFLLYFLLSLVVQVISITATHIPFPFLSKLTTKRN